MNKISKYLLILAVFCTLAINGNQARAVESVVFEQNQIGSNSSATVGQCYYQSFVASTSNFTKVAIWASSGHTVVLGLANYINCVTPETAPYNFLASTSVSTVNNNWTIASFATTSLTIGRTYFVKACHNSAGTMTLYRSNAKVLNSDSIWYYPASFCGGRLTSDLAFRIYADVPVVATTSTSSVQSMSIDLSSSTPSILGNSISFFSGLMSSTWPVGLAIAISVGFAVMIKKFLNKILK